jgi:hypothetical protein
VFYAVVKIKRRVIYMIRSLNHNECQIVNGGGNEWGLHRYLNTIAAITTACGLVGILATHVIYRHRVKTVQKDDPEAQNKFKALPERSQSVSYAIAGITAGIAGICNFIGTCVSE